MPPPRALTLRPARLDDAAVMAALSRDWIESGLSWRYTPRRMAELIANPDTVALVACDGIGGGGIHGFAVMGFGDETAHLSLLCVRPSQQRCGVGRRLMDWLLASARVAGIAQVDLELRADNAGAFAFYSRIGFVPRRLLPSYYDGRIAAQCMELALR